MSVRPLRTLVDAGHDVALVVTRADKRRGRGSALVPSPVKLAAEELALPTTSTLQDATDVGAELGVVVAYGRIIPGALLDRLPMVNLHFSLLPRWRGAAPVERALLEGDRETGVCLMAVERGLDTGAVYAEESVTIGDDETAEELRERLVAVGCDLLRTHLADGLAGLPVPREQEGEPSYAEKLSPADHRIDWSRTAREVHRVVRVGRAWTTFRSRRLGIVAVEILDEGPPGGAGGAPGTLDGLVVATGRGRVRLVTVHPEGRRTMAAEDWVHGAAPGEGERLGAPAPA
jgi:methionyl-tRNA formyltransferase